MDYRFERSAYWGVASRLTVLAHLFGILAFILMLVWLLHFRGGIDYESYYHEQVFNVHPFLMFCGFIFLVGQAMMAYKTVLAEHRVQRFVHMLLHLIAIILGIVGICAAFKYHDMLGAGDLYTLHSWIGIGTFCLFGLQWLFGLFTFMGGRDLTTMREMLPWHKSGGRALLYMAVCAALTGLMQKSIYPIPRPHPESHLINFTGLFILLFGIFVDLSVSLGHYIS